MRAREIFLALLIIAAGVLLTYEKSGRLDGWFEGWDGSWFGDFDEFVYEETREIAGPLPPELEVVNAHGQIEVTGTATDTASVLFTERISARNKDEADRIAASLRMIVTPSGSRLILSTNRDEFKRKNFSTSFKIVVPSGTAVLLKNSYGLVRTEGTGPAEIANPHGDVVVRGIAGPLILTSSYEEIDVDGVGRDAQIGAPHSEVTVKNIEGDLILDHSYGAVHLDRIVGKTIVNGSHSEVNTRGLSAQAEISTTYETIRIEDAGPVRIRARHCDIAAKNIGGLFDATNTYGRIRVENIGGDLKIDGQNVEVEGLVLRSPDVSVRTTYENVSLSGFAGKTSVFLSHGRLNLEPDPALSGSVDVQGNYLDVQMLWPAGFRAPFEARTRDGRIFWNLPEGPDLQKSNGITELKAFSRETGKPAIKIETSHGDVQVDAAGR
jgi:hypothetical protein